MTRKHLVSILLIVFCVAQSSFAASKSQEVNLSTEQDSEMLVIEIPPHTITRSLGAEIREIIDRDLDPTTKNEELVHAARQGWHQVVEFLLLEGADANTSELFSSSALYEAAKEGHTETVKILLEWGAKPTGWNDPLKAAVLEGHVGVVAALLETNSAPEGLGASLLALAVQSGTIDMVKLLLERLPKRDAMSLGDALMEAAERSDKYILELLFEKGATVKMVDSNGANALLHAAGSCQLEIVDVLFARGALITNDKRGNNPLMAAAGCQDKKQAVVVLARLLGQGADAQASNNLGETALHRAAAQGNAAALDLLLQHGAPVDSRTILGITPLMAAAKGRATEATNHLLEAGASVNTRDLEGRTSLIRAAQADAPKQVEILLKAGARADLPDVTGSSAIFYAAEEGTTETLEYLLRAGADLETRDREGFTPLMRAAVAGQSRSVEFLLARGAQVEARDRLGVSALMLASLKGDTETASRLLAKNADPNARDLVGRRPLMFATLGESEEIMELLLDSGARVNEADDFGVTALLIAIQLSDFDLAQVLLKAGAPPLPGEFPRSLEEPRNWSREKKLVSSGFEGNGSMETIGQPSQEVPEELKRLRSAILSDGTRIRKFPWPPPRPSSFVELPSSTLLGGNNIGNASLGTVASRLTTALLQTGYVEKSWYWIPEGFALVTRMERINPDGTPGDPNRWAIGAQEPHVFSLRSYLKALFSATPGHYRVITFLITSKAFAPDPSRLLSSDVAESLVFAGSVSLPQPIADLPFSKHHRCTVYVYEFEQPTADHEASIVTSTSLTGLDHLQRAGLWDLLGK